MCDLRFGRPDPLDFPMLLNEFPDSQFKRITRSTIPLLCYWAQWGPRLDQVCEAIGCRPPQHCDICFEYPVPSWGGNTPSYTDIMCVSNELGIAIEGKSTERPEKTVDEWLGPHPTENKMGVLAHWLELIGPVTGLAVEGMDFDPFHGVTYQMIHRTASACSLGAGRTAVIYQVFDIGAPAAQPEHYYQRALEALANAIGAAGNLDIWLHYVKAQANANYTRTRVEVERAKPQQIPGIIRRAIRAGGLFEFGPENWTPISIGG